MEGKQKLMNRVSDEIQRKLLKDVFVLEEKISEMEIELHEASAEMRKLTVERKQAEVEVRASDTSSAGFGREDSVWNPRL